MLGQVSGYPENFLAYSAFHVLLNNFDHQTYPLTGMCQSLKIWGAHSNAARLLICQNLGGTCPPCPPPLWTMPDYSTYRQKLGEDFAKFCGLLRIYELYNPSWSSFLSYFSKSVHTNILPD